MKSDILKKGIDTIPHRSLLDAAGVSRKDYDKPFIGIANSYNDIIPGHVHLNELTEEVKRGIRDGGGLFGRGGLHRLRVCGRRAESRAFQGFQLPHDAREGRVGKGFGFTGQRFGRDVPRADRSVRIGRVRLRRGASERGSASAARTAHAHLAGRGCGARDEVHRDGLIATGVDALGRESRAGRRSLRR